MAKARILAVVIIGLMLLTLLIPGFAVLASLESPPGKPVNLSPDNATTEISPLHGFFTAAYSGTDLPLNAQWQIVQSDSQPSLNPVDGSYDKPPWDSGLVGTGDNPTYAFPVGLLDYGKTYWWHVRLQDNTGAWSPWSDQTWFHVIGNSPPNQPENLDPAIKETGVSLTPTLRASGFTDPDALGYEGLNDTHQASRWQVTKAAGNYSSPSLVYDSGITTTGLTSIVVVKQDGTPYLLKNTSYYWRVRYRDSYNDFDDDEEEHWSAYSSESSFTTKSLSVPVASFSADTTEVVADEDLVTFTDNSTPVAEIASWTWNFGDGTTESWTGDTRPPNGEISHKYTASPATGDSYTVTLTVYSDAATTGVVDTMEIVVHETPAAGFTVTPSAPKAGEDITFMDISTSVDDIESWEWLFDDGTTETWTARPANGQITHKFKKGGEHAVSLRVKGEGDLGESVYNKKINVMRAGGFQFGLWMVAVGVGVVVVIAGAVYLLRARKGK
jgi:PKD repeat protein